MKNQVYDTFDLRPFCSNILVDIPNHDEEEGEAEEADELAMIFNSFGGPSGKRGGEGLCFNGLVFFFFCIRMECMCRIDIYYMYCVSVVRCFPIHARILRIVIGVLQPLRSFLRVIFFCTIVIRSILLLFCA